MAPATFFDRIVAASGLSPVIAPFTVSRLLVRADVRPDTVTPGELARALPVLEEGLGVYLRGTELERACRDVRALAEGAA
jgi:hypothetical protein